MEQYNNRDRSNFEEQQHDNFCTVDHSPTLSLILYNNSLFCLGKGALVLM